MDEVVTIAHRLSEVGFPTLCALIGYGSYKRIWVWGYQLQAAEADRDRWMHMALQATGLAEKSTEFAKLVRPT